MATKVTDKQTGADLYKTGASVPASGEYELVDAQGNTTDYDEITLDEGERFPKIKDNKLFFRLKATCLDETCELTEKPKQAGTTRAAETTRQTVRISDRTADSNPRESNLAEDNLRDVIDDIRNEAQDPPLPVLANNLATGFLEYSIDITMTSLMFGVEMNRYTRAFIHQFFDQGIFGSPRYSTR